MIRADEVVDYKSGAILELDAATQTDVVKSAYVRQLRIYGYLVKETRVAARGELVQGDAEREQIGARVERGAQDLLRRHIGRGAEPRAGVGEPHARSGRCRDGTGLGVEGAPAVRRRCARHDLLGQPEIHHLKVALRRHHHVGGLQVAVHEAAPMGGVELI